MVSFRQAKRKLRLHIDKRIAEDEEDLVDSREEMETDRAKLGEAEAGAEVKPKRRES